MSSDAMFETEFIFDVTDDVPVRLARMAFTADELRAITHILSNPSAEYQGWNPQIKQHFYRAWVEVSTRSVQSFMEFKLTDPNAT